MNPQLAEGLKRLIVPIVVAVVGVVGNAVTSNQLPLDPTVQIIVLGVIVIINQIAYAQNDNARAKKYDMKPSDVGYNETMASRGVAHRVSL